MARSGLHLLYFRLQSDAVRRNDISTIKQHLSLGIIQLEANGETLLHVAVKYSKQKALEFLLNSTQNDGSWINLKDKEGDTLLTCACSKGSYDISSLLITKYNANVNVAGKLNSPLHGAICSKNYDLIEFLLKRNDIDINLRTTLTRQTPLHTACLTNSEKCIAMLVSYNAKTDVKDMNNMLPANLITAKDVKDKFLDILLPGSNKCDGISTNANDIATVKFTHKLSPITDMQANSFTIVQPVKAAYNHLIGNQIKSSDEYRCSKLQFAAQQQDPAGHVQLQADKKKNKIEIDDFDSDLNTPLADACKNGHIENVKLLIEHGADINFVGMYKGPLFNAVKNNHQEIVDYLLQQWNIDVNKQTLLDRLSPLHAAAKTNNIVYVKQLLMHGADPTTISSQHRIPADLSTNNEIKQLLSQYQSEINELLTAMVNNKIDDIKKYIRKKGKQDVEVFKTKTKFGSLLHIAASLSNSTIISMLLHKGHPIDCTWAPSNQTPLHSACLTDKLDNIKLLCERGANVFARMKNGTTVLHLAAAYSSCDSVYYLLTNYPKLSVNLTDNEGNTPLTKACYEGKYDTAELLLQKGADINAMGQSQGPLQAAIKSKNNNLVTFLLNQANIDVNRQTTARYTTALHVACEINDKEIVELLLTKKSLNCNLRTVSGKLAKDITTNITIRDLLQNNSRVSVLVIKIIILMKIGSDSEISGSAKKANVLSLRYRFNTR